MSVLCSRFYVFGEISAFYSKEYEERGGKQNDGCEYAALYAERTSGEKAMIRFLVYTENRFAFSGAAYAYSINIALHEIPYGMDRTGSPKVVKQDNI